MSTAIAILLGLVVVLGLALAVGAARAAGHADRASIRARAELHTGEGLWSKIGERRRSERRQEPVVDRHPDRRSGADRRTSQARGSGRAS